VGGEYVTERGIKKHYVLLYGLLNHLNKPVLDMTSSLVRAYQLGFSQGDLTFAGHAIAMHCAGRLVAGSSLRKPCNRRVQFLPSPQGVQTNDDVVYLGDSAAIVLGVDRPFRRNGQTNKKGT
jgi:hypothetical protein